MDRENAITIEVTDWSSSDFWKLISDLDNEGCIYDQPEFKKDGIVWFEQIPMEMFKFSHCFNWLRGSSNIWHNDIPVTKLNYRTKVIDVKSKEDCMDEVFHYEYIPYIEMTKEPPIINDITN